MKTTQTVKTLSKELKEISLKDFYERTDLTWKAKGIFSYLLTLSKEELNDIETIRDRSKEGLSAFRSGWKELEDAGYVKRYPIFENGRVSEWRTKICKVR